MPLVNNSGMIVFGSEDENLLETISSVLDEFVLEKREFNNPYLRKVYIAREGVSNYQGFVEFGISEKFGTYWIEYMKGLPIDEPLIRIRVLGCMDQIIKQESCKKYSFYFESLSDVKQFIRTFVLMHSYAACPIWEDYYHTLNGKLIKHFHFEFDSVPKSVDVSFMDNCDGAIVFSYGVNKSLGALMGTLMSFRYKLTAENEIRPSIAILSVDNVIDVNKIGVEVLVGRNLFSIIW